MPLGFAGPNTESLVVVAATRQKPISSFCLQGRGWARSIVLVACTDVIAALIGRPGPPRPARAPASETPRRVAPAPRTERRGYGGGAGLGPAAEAGGHPERRRQQAGGGDLEQRPAGPGRLLRQVEVS